MEAVIIDSGGANLASLQYACERLGARTHVTNEARMITSAARVILPGVGAAAGPRRELDRLRRRRGAEAGLAGLGDAGDLSYGVKMQH